MKVFDFDNTLYRGESSVDFSFYMIQHNKKILRYVPTILFSLVGYKLCLLKKEKIESIINDFFAGVLDGTESLSAKLKLNGGDVKAVQGDSGHAQVDMVTNVYSHIIDEDRKKNAQLFEEAFYGKKDLDPQIHGKEEERKVAVPEGIDPEVLAKVLANPETVALLASLAKGMGGQ